MNLPQLKPQLLYPYLSARYPLVINNNLIINYCADQDSGTLMYRNRENLVIKVSLSSIRPVGDLTWTNGDGVFFDINYTDSHFEQIIKTRYEELRKNPTVMYFTGDPEHRLHRAFWLGQGGMFSISSHLKGYDPEVDMISIETDITGPSANSRHETLEAVEFILNYVKQNHLKHNSN